MATFKRYQDPDEKTTEKRKSKSKVFIRIADIDFVEVPPMDIVIGRTARINKDSSKENSPQYFRQKKRITDRRKNKQDRRKSVRDGVIVTLSYKNDRRVLRDRRKKRS